MKKRLLLVTEGFPYGETERSFLGEEVRHLADAFDLTVLALDNGKELIYPVEGIRRVARYRIPPFRSSISLHMLADVFRISTLQEVFRCAKKNGFSGIPTIFKEIVYFRFKAWAAKGAIRRLVEEEKIDVAYTYWCNGAALAAVELKRFFPHLKVITRFHGADLYEERMPINWQPFRKEIAAGADGLCFACTNARDYFTRNWGAECTEKMHLHYLGSTDRGALERRKDSPLQIVSCSNLIPLKQVERIIEGLALLPENVEVAWDLFGDGTERAKLESLAEEKLRDRSNVTWKFHGFVPNQYLGEAYRRLAPALFITTSSTEGGAPVSIQEAFSMGIPAIGTPVGGIPDLIVDGKTGFLLPEQVRPQDVADAVMRFYGLRAEEKAEMFAAARQRWAEQFDAVKNAVRFTEYLLEMASEQGQSRK